MILLFGGTTEGRAAARVLDEAGSPFFYSTKGNLQEIRCSHGHRLTGAMTVADMVSFCRKEEIRLIVDAAHPFAEELHASVAEATEQTGIPVVRYERQYPPREEGIVWCANYDTAAERMLGDGVQRLLMLTGVNTIPKLAAFWKERTTFCRILKRDESVALAEKNGFPVERIVFFEPHADEVLMQAVRPDAIITKESGESGYFREKIEAARRMGIRIYAVVRPSLPPSFIPVGGPVGLRRAVERLVPGFFSLRSGFTTGTTATAAVVAAMHRLMGLGSLAEAPVELPSGEIVSLPIAEIREEEDAVVSAVLKDAGDDPDVTNGMAVCATIRLNPEHEEVRFLQGEGVGVVTLPGLGLEVGGPAINLVPRRMMTAEVRRLYAQGGVDITISVPEGREAATQTFNPRLGIRDGISIIGTSGVVKPFSAEAFVGAIRKQVGIATALGANHIVLNSGAKSERYVKGAYPALIPQAFVQYGNFVGESLSCVASFPSVRSVTVGIMLGKAVKLAEGYLDTHSKKVVMNRDFLHELARQAGCSEDIHAMIDSLNLARELWTMPNAEDSDRLLRKIAERSWETCRPSVPSAELELLLIDESGTIRFRIKGE
ncbi:cobalt-precorrin-5B (C(1))-methyltransferase CbiD [uncultured Porphyromonas sp.]|uniref:cobalt-precorrin-5B (C(1))-methyltransferase CbiD n=1 Tax=uncultured Porphyromonas sp. TaxID=159274 RepID=UPI002804DEC0|nr:cobalt-precorrin-5B (C(1))-methyltransferase CbiD [uncultured Porphyromonas sp.]